MNLNQVTLPAIDMDTSFDQMPQDQRYLWREAKLRDPAGNRIVLFWGGDNRKHPPWRVEKRA